MPSRNVFQPKQQRSQDTQHKLLSALHFCLEQKFFEHISIKELAEHAEVSVGTFYRRFKNKESLLPLLYQDFGSDLLSWTEQLEQRSFGSLEETVHVVTRETYEFIRDRKSVFRTLHLNSRLHSDILTSDTAVDRKVVYQRLAKIFLTFDDDIKATDKENASTVVVFTLVASLLDKILYPDITPAIACELDGEEYANELAKMLLSYLI